MTAAHHDPADTRPPFWHFFQNHPPAELARVLSLEWLSPERRSFRAREGTRLAVFDRRLPRRRILTEAVWGIPLPWTPAPHQNLCYLRSETACGNRVLARYPDVCPCVVPASAFYVHPKDAPAQEPGGVCRRDQALMLYAGVLCSWLSARGRLVDGCAILTSPADPALTPDNQRMPFILRDDDVDRWLEQDVATGEGPFPFLPFPADALEFFPPGRDTLHRFRANRPPLEEVAPRSRPNAARPMPGADGALKAPSEEDARAFALWFDLKLADSMRTQFPLPEEAGPGRGEPAPPMDLPLTGDA